MRSVRALSIVLSLALLTAGCRDDADVPELEPVGTETAAEVEPESGGPDAGQGDAVPPPPTGEPIDFEKAKADNEEWRAEMDEYGRGLLASFENRVYAPARDSGLRFVEGVAKVRCGDATGTYAFTFDAEREEDDRVTLTPGEGTGGLPKGSDRQVASIARLGLAGGYRYVVNYLPPVQLVLTRSRDGENLVVTAPPHHRDVSVSYSVDPTQDLVKIRGAATDSAREIAYFDWLFTKGRYLVERHWVHGSDATIDFEYDDRATNGVLLPSRVLIRKGESAFDIAFSYDRVDIDD